MQQLQVQLLAVKKKTCNQTSETETHRVPICSKRHSKQTLGVAKVPLSNLHQAIALEPVAASARHWQQQQKHPSRRPGPVADVDPARCDRNSKHDPGMMFFNSRTIGSMWIRRKRALLTQPFGQKPSNSAKKINLWLKHKTAKQ